MRAERVMSKQGRRANELSDQRDACAIAKQQESEQIECLGRYLLIKLLALRFHAHFGWRLPSRRAKQPQLERRRTHQQLHQGAAGRSCWCVQAMRLV